MQHNIMLTVSYDGSSYHGFQAQRETNQTIQTQLELAIARLTGKETTVIGSGRTDAGVHARGQVVNFWTDSAIPEDRWALALNSMLPDDIVIREARFVSQDFHARKSAEKKTYRYTIDNNRIPNVLLRHMQVHVPLPLQPVPMEQALQHLVGEHDFSSFCSVKSTQQSHIRTIYDAWLEHAGDGVYHIFVNGNGFLYNMVRIIAGTVIEVGLGKRSVEKFAQLLTLRDRTQGGITAPAHGLVLWEVDYGDALQIKP